MRRDIAFVIATELVVVLAGLIVYRFAHERLGPDGFATYSLCRRTLSFFTPVVLVGLTVALPRYIAASAATGGHASGPYVAGLVILATIQVPVWTVSVIFPRRLSVLLFGDGSFEHLILPLTLVLASLVSHAACYAYFRGHLIMRSANFLQLSNLGVIPLAGMSIGRDLAEILVTTGGMSLFVSGLFFLTQVAPRLRLRLDLASIRQLLAYGVQRLPGDFGLAALLGLPALLATHASGVQEGGKVAFSISLLTMAASGFGPIGTIMLPAASRAITLRDFRTLGIYLRRLVGVSATVAGVGTLVYQFAAEPLLGAYLGGDLDPTLVTCTRRIMLCAAPYCLYVATRSIIDAWFVLSLNTINIVLALATFLCISLGPFAGADVVQALWWSTGLLGTLTLATCAYIGAECCTPSRN